MQDPAGGSGDEDDQGFELTRTGSSADVRDDLIAARRTPLSKLEQLVAFIETPASLHHRAQLTRMLRYYSDRFDECVVLRTLMEQAVEQGQTRVSMDYPDNCEPSVELMHTLEGLFGAEDPDDPQAPLRFMVERRQLRPEACRCAPADNCVGTCRGGKRSIQLCVSWSRHLYTTPRALGRK